jgi:hypothetical protein
MTPEAIVTELRAAGVRLTIEDGKIKATGDKAALARWLPVMRERKAEIIAALKVGAGDTARSVWWRLHFADREPLEIACTPPATREEVLAGRHGVTAAEPFEPAIMPAAEMTNRNHAAAQKNDEQKSVQY